MTTFELSCVFALIAFAIANKIFQIFKSKPKKSRHVFISFPSGETKCISVLCNETISSFTRKIEKDFSQKNFFVKQLCGVDGDSILPENTQKFEICNEICGGVGGSSVDNKKSDTKRFGILPVRRRTTHDDVMSPASSRVPRAEIHAFLKTLRTHLETVATPHSNLARLSIAFLNKEFNLDPHVDVRRFAQGDTQESSRVASRLAVATQRAVSFFGLQSTLFAETLKNVEKQIEVTRVNKPALMDEQYYTEQFVEPLIDWSKTLDQLLEQSKSQQQEAQARFEDLRELATRPVMEQLRRSSTNFNGAFQKLDYEPLEEVCALAEKLGDLPSIVPSNVQLKQMVKVPEGSSSPSSPDVRSQECLQLLYIAAIRARDRLEARLASIQKKSGKMVHLEMGNVKSVERAMEKAVEEYGGDFTRLIDLARGTIVCENIQDLLKVLAVLHDTCSSEASSNSFQILRVKNRLDPVFPATFVTGGYRDILVNIAIDHHICEVQIQLQSFILLKQGGAHQLYSVARSLHLLDPNLGDVRVTSREEYSSALERVQGGTCHSFHVDFLPLSRQDCEALQNALSSTACIVHNISMAGCGLTEETSEILARGNYGMFRSVRLFNNKGVSGSCVAAFVTSALEVLDLLDCNLDHSSSIVVCQALTDSTPKCLRELSLGGCHVGVDGAKLLAKCLRQATQLVSLDLYRTGLGAQGGELIAGSIKGHKHLSFVNLAKNELGDDGVEFVAEILASNPALTSVHLGSNHVGNRGWKRLAEALQHSKSVTALDFGGRGEQTDETNGFIQAIQSRLTSNRQSLKILN